MNELLPTVDESASSARQAIKIVPKGLRSFDAEDANFFLDLLPGPRDREGLPDSIRFWKGRIEERDADNTFSVGLIYGPSGCGKSSLVKAGLLPRLAKSVRTVYLEATAGETEVRLLKGLRRQVPDLPPNLGLIETMAELRRGRFLASGDKLLLVLDQFEQWLHAKRNEENTDLVKALRQCEGGRLQCLVLVRDDFWMATTRFLHDLEIRLLEGQNSAAVDLVPLRHAEKVLAAFGHAFGALPEAGPSAPLDPSLQALVNRLEHLSDPYRELREGVRKAIQVAGVDPEMALTRTRKVLEYVIRDVYERRIQEPPGTRPLENLLQRLVKDGHFPDRLDAYANTIRKLGNVGTHTFGEKVAVADVHLSLRQLVPILDWYFEVERPEAVAGKPIVAPPPSRPSENAFLAAEDQEAFLRQAVSGLAQDGKIICVRLALFAEMMKGKAWVPATLQEVGGAEGIGVTFLEETFSAAGAPPEHRYHQKAARSVLKALLPEAGTEIKGHMRSRQELLEASGYASRPRDFEDLLQILDGELRLLTPADPEGKQDADPSTVQAGARYYQLTHDYLVPSLRDWLTRKQKETRRGRAELLLADQAAVWKARPENRQLPSLLQWLQIRWLTRKESWTPPQRKMMRLARWHHAVRGLALAVVLLIVVVSGLLIRSGVVEQQKMTHAEGLVHRLLDADIAQVPGIVAEIEPYRPWANPLLREENDRAADKSREKLHTSLALLPVDPGQMDYLYGRLLDAAPSEVAIIRDFLAPHKDELLDALWNAVEAPKQGKESQRLRAAAALAKYDPNGERWAKVREAVANDLVTVPAVYLAVWMDSLRPLRVRLLAPLSAIYRDGKRREVERSLAADILADYAADQLAVLADLVMDAEEKQFAAIYPKLREQGEQGLHLLTAEINKKLPSDLPSSDEKRETLAKRQANAAVALLRMNQSETVWPLLKHSPDPRVRSYLIHRLSPLGADAGAIIQRFEEESDITIRRALLLSLGEYSDKDFSLDSRIAMLPKLQDIYRTASDPGLHAAAEWLLRQWKQEAWLNQVNDEWTNDPNQREKRLEWIKQMLAKKKEKTPPQWYVNGQGQTMVVIPGPVPFLMGSPVTETGREPGGPDGSWERQNRVSIGHSFAIAVKEVTVKQYQRYCEGQKAEPLYAPDLECPMNNLTWYNAAGYCNWLSKQEGITDPKQWCYEPNSKGEYAEGMKLAPDYLHRNGYRLPSEAEWEYACRAGAVTSRSYGETEELLENYAWYTKNSQDRRMLCVGSLRPNDLGLFDMLGNAAEWCQERLDFYPSTGNEQVRKVSEDQKPIEPDKQRVLRGSSLFGQSRNVRCGRHHGNLPGNGEGDFGFRVARSLVP